MMHRDLLAWKIGGVLSFGVFCSVASLLIFFIGTASATQPMPTPNLEEEGLNPFVAILFAVIAIAGVLLVVGKKQSGENEGDSAERAWWTTKKGRELLISILLLFLMLIGLVWAGFEGLIAVALLAVGWMGYRHFTNTTNKEGVMHTNEVAKKIARTYNKMGFKLDSQRGVSAVVLSAINVHLIAFKSPNHADMVFEEDLKTGRITGAFYATLQGRVDEIYAKKELFMPAEIKGGEKGSKPQITQINTEEGE